LFVLPFVVILNSTSVDIVTLWQCHDICEGPS